MAVQSETLTIVDDLLHRVPPHSTEVEQAILQAILMDRDAMPMCIGRVDAADFHRPTHQAIYLEALKLFQEGHAIDTISVGERLKDAGRFEDCGGFSYMTDLMLSYCTSANLEYSIGRLKSLSIQRQVIQAGFEAVYHGFEREGQDALSQAQAALMLIDTQQKEVIPLSELLNQAVEELTNQHYHRQTPGTVLTGYPGLDEITGGLKSSQLIILAARPAMGKTTLGLNIAANVAIRQQQPVIIFSLEMSPAEIAQRLLRAESGNFTNRLREKADQLSGVPLRIIDCAASFGTPQLRAAMMRQRIEMGGLSLVVIDYLQLMRGEGENRVQEVSGLSRELKGLAREFDIPILCLSQLSRAVESRQDKRPMLSDLRESGAIEQDSDLVMFIYREDYYRKDSDRPGVTDIIIAKHRNGPTGEVTLSFRASATQFMSL